MFQNRDPNVPLAPTVHVPSLGSGPKASCFTPTVFRTSAAVPTESHVSGKRKKPANCSPLPPSVPPPPPQHDALHVVECDPALAAPGHPESVDTERSPTALFADPAKDCLLSNEDFVEELVREVRLTCQKAQHEQAFGEEAKDSLRRATQQNKPVFVCPGPTGDVYFAGRPERSLSPSPRDIMLTDSATTSAAATGAQPSGGDALYASLSGPTSRLAYRPARARSPSPVPCTRGDDTLQLAGCDGPTSPLLIHGKLDRLETGAISPSTVGLAASSRTSSPGPRPPHSGPYSPGGALSNSLRRNRSPGVPRDLIRDVAAKVDGDVTDDDRDLPYHTGTPRGRSRSRSRSRDEHPQWTPRAVSSPRPAWNQRQPTPRARPVVSVPGLTPTRNRRASDTDNVAHAPRHRPHLSSPATANTNAGQVVGESSQPSQGTARLIATPREGAPNRVLFASQHQSLPSSAPVTLEDVMRRTVQAEERVEALEAALHRLSEQHARSMEAWSTRCMQLTQQVQFLLEWARQQPSLQTPTEGVPAPVSVPLGPAADATVLTAVETAPTNLTGAEVTQSNEKGCFAEEKEKDGSVASSEDGEGLGATPTPVRRPDVRSGHHTGNQIRVPPSPPLVLQMRSALQQ